MEYSIAFPMRQNLRGANTLFLLLDVAKRIYIQFIFVIKAGVAHRIRRLCCRYHEFI